jgi:hypothetical protein
LIKLLAPLQSNYTILSKEKSMIFISKLLLTLLITIAFSSSFWGFQLSNTDSTTVRKKQQFYLYWGYNRSAYTTSDIRMVGNGYDYTLYDVRAKDKPEEFDPKVYFNIAKISIPQFNIRGGWAITDKLWLSGGYDHMKYVVRNDQTVKISGTIDSSASPQYAGTYNQNDIEIKSDFLAFEHTDGLNFISFDLDYVSPLWKSKNEKFRLEHLIGVSAGILFPRTDVIIFDKRGPNIWNLAGVGIAAKSQLRFYIYNHFFIEGVAKAGRINMPKIQTTGIEGEWAKQKFSFIEGFWAIGYRFSI